MELPTKMISFGVAAVSALGGLYGGATFTHDKLQQIDAMEQNISLIDYRLESKILADRYALLEQRIRDIESRYGTDLFDAPGPVREQYRIMTNELKALDREMNAVQQDYKRQGSSGNRYYDRTPNERDK